MSLYTALLREHGISDKGNSGENACGDNWIAIKTFFLRKLIDN